MTRAGTQVDLSTVEWSPFTWPERLSGGHEIVTGPALDGTHSRLMVAGDERCRPHGGGAATWARHGPWLVCEPPRPDAPTWGRG